MHSQPESQPWPAPSHWLQIFGTRPQMLSALHLNGRSRSPVLQERAACVCGAHVNGNVHVYFMLVIGTTFPVEKSNSVESHSYILH